MAEERNNDDTDTGISYRAAPTAIQKLLDKVKARKKSVGEETDRSMNGLPQVASLSSMLDDIIEFKTDAQKRKENKWAAIQGGLGGATGGSILGAYVGTLHPEATSAWIGESMQQGMRQGMNAIEEQIGEGWKPEDYGKKEPFQKGQFSPEEAKARSRFNKRKALNRKVLKRIGKYSAIGAATFGTLGALGGYAAKKAGMNQQTKQLNSMLDNLIQFGDFNISHPGSVVESVWRRLKKPSAKTVSSIRDRYRNPGQKLQEEIDPHVRRGIRDMSRAFDKVNFSEPIQFGITDRIASALTRFNKPKIGSWTGGHLLGAGLGAAATAGIIKSGLDKQKEKRDRAAQLNSKLDDLINFQGDPRPRNNLGEFTDQGEGGPNPNDMVKTYQVAPQQKTQMNQALSATSLAVLGGAGGAAGAHGYKSLAAWVRKTARNRK